MFTYEVNCDYDSNLSWNEVSPFLPFPVSILESSVVLSLFSEVKIEVDIAANDGEIVHIEQEHIDGHDLVDWEVVFTIGIQACLK